MMNIDLSTESWRIVHAMLMDDPVPRRAQVQAILAFEVALKASQDEEKAKEPPE